MPDPDSIDKLIQRYNSRFSDAVQAVHSTITVGLLGGRANRATLARSELEAVIAGTGTSAKASELLAACNGETDMASAALEYQVRINEVILGFPIQ